MIKPKSDKLRRFLSFAVLLSATFATFFALTFFVVPRLRPVVVAQNVDSKVVEESSSDVITRKKYCGEIRLKDFYISEEKDKKAVFSVGIAEAVIAVGPDGERVAHLKNMNVDFFSGGDSPGHFYNAKQSFDYDMSRKLTETLTKQLDADIVEVDNVVMRFYEGGYVSSVLLGDKGFINDGIGGFLIYGHVNIVGRFGDKLSSGKILWTQADDNFHVEGGFSLCRGVESRRGKKVVVDYMLNEVREPASKQAFYVSG